MFILVCVFLFFFKHKTAYEMRISDWSSDVCSSDLLYHVDPFLAEALSAANVDLDLCDPSAFRLRQDALRLVAAAYQIDLDRWNGNFGHGQSAPEWIDDK